MALQVEQLSALLRLDPESGLLFWKKREADSFPKSGKQSSAVTAAQWNAQYAGKPALMSKNKNGYRHGGILGKTYLAHRVVFALHTGQWATDFVDHIDGDILNNRPSNLRNATARQSQHNTGKKKKNATSKYIGVSWCSTRKRWSVSCTDSFGKIKNCGRFHCEIEAARAYDAAARKWHGEFARLNFPAEPNPYEGQEA